MDRDELNIIASSLGLISDNIPVNNYTVQDIPTSENNFIATDNIDFVLPDDSNQVVNIPNSAEDDNLNSMVLYFLSTIYFVSICRSFLFATSQELT